MGDRTLNDICGSEGVKVRRITRTYGKGKDLLVIENIPVITCTNCGESYLQQIAIKRTTDKSTKTNAGLCFRINFCGGFDKKLL